MDATLFAALGEPHRLRIVELLRARPHAVGDLVDALTVRQPQVSKHLRVLRDAGVVTVEPLARQRIYRLRSEPFAELDAWLDTFVGHWEARLDALDDVLGTVTAADETGRTS